MNMKIRFLFTVLLLPDIDFFTAEFIGELFNFLQVLFCT